MALGNIDTEVAASWTGPPVVRASGEIDLAVAPTLDTHIAAALDRNLGVVVDLSEATFIDSVALGVITSALQRCQSEHVPLYLVMSDPRVTKVFDLTGLTSTFAIFESLDDVRAHLGLSGAASS